MGDPEGTKDLHTVLTDDAARLIAYAAARRLELASAVLDELRVRYPTTPVFGELR